MNLELEGKVALITGGASGIGEACVKRLVQLGCTVVVADIDVEAGNALIATMPEATSFIALDVTDYSSWTRALQVTVSRHGHIDILHLNAGVMSRPRGSPLLNDPLKWFRPDIYHKVVGVNLDGTINGLMACVELSIYPGRIVVTASGAAIEPLPLDPFYTATKFAALGIVLALVPSFAELGIRLDVLCPGAIDTPITAPDIREHFAQEPADFIADALIHVLGEPLAPNNAWTAMSRVEGVKPYFTGGDGNVLSSIEAR